MSLEAVFKELMPHVKFKDVTADAQLVKELLEAKFSPALADIAFKEYMESNDGG